MPPSELQVRAGRVDDLVAVSEIQSLSAEAAAWPVQDYLGYSFYVVEQIFPKKELIGFGAWREVTTGEWELLNLAVHPAFRRRGAGGLLLGKLLEDRPDSVFLEVRQSNIAARTLYGLYGFTEVGHRRNYYSSPSENAIVLRFQK